MAEHYGVKPKIFTKEWWPYYWMYYKWHTIIGVFAAILIVMTVTECANKEHYDLEMTYSSDIYYDDEVWDKVETALERDIKDIDDNGEKNILISPIVIVDEKGYEEQNYAMQMKHIAEMSDELMYVYIYDEKTVKNMDETVRESFCTVDEWLETEVPDDMLISSSDGKAHGVSLRNSSILKSAGVDSENLYVLVRLDAGPEKRNEKARQNALIVANNLIK